MATKKKARKKAAAKTPVVVDPREHRKPTPAALKDTLQKVKASVEGLTPPEEPCAGDLVDAMVHIFFADLLVDGYGQEARRLIAESFVDRNEFRVTEAYEVQEILAPLEVPELFERCLGVRDAVAQVYNDQNSVSLEFLREATVTERNQFLMRVPAVNPMVARWLITLVSFEECLFSEKSTLRVQQRLGLDPKSQAVVKFIVELREILAPFGHIPIDVAGSAAKSGIIEKPELSAASWLSRLAPPKKKK